ncbi:TPA: hypothetical protein QDB15_004305 [Burkholderia vietnamiensis]|uniref:Secreted protein n=1 Tax=Burkholderia aenigmatica TaxID=2015348 RepID=A0A228HNT1_9BURK|nr:MULTISPECIES: hypothetical protein [Burkholderia cepacia complex]KVR74385.1 hypothetical protein WK24_07230 [Burkholderia vietnamiensis]MBR8009304.1 hypothetical protein [Burkholderia vietnamiensis]MBR8150834.1 hypothetical protein [Burkholderia vietnamiensis]MBR8164836.1 hypothetical protein [Burkholderia vietnamiensis]MBR8193044.1 hypothetical protein [Burkholderia vietnamiensis]
MKFLPRVMLAIGCWLAMVVHAEAAPVRCSYGYQDSTCTTPLRNGPIPQPQCSSGPGWTTVSASIWQGSHWSAPQCSYQAAPTCPNGYDTVAAPVWSGSSWTAPVCTVRAQTPPPTSNWAQICNQAAAARGYTTHFTNSMFNPYTFGTGVATMGGDDGMAIGPPYINGDLSTNQYDATCFVRTDNGAIYQLWIVEYDGYQAGN